MRSKLHVSNYRLFLFRYGWHFPELGKIITDNLAFVRTVELMGTREIAKSNDLSNVLPEEVEEKVKEAAEISMGTEISGEPGQIISCLWRQNSWGMQTLLLISALAWGRK